jgi:hypothetical protein
MLPRTFDLLGPVACLPADAALAAGCDSLTPLHFPGRTGSTALEGVVPAGQRICWTVHLDTERGLDVRLGAPGGGATLEVRSQALTSTSRPTGMSSHVSSSASTSSSTIVSSSSSSAVTSASGGETRVSVGPQSQPAEFLIAVSSTGKVAAPYRLVVTLR